MLLGGVDRNEAVDELCWGIEVKSSLENEVIMHFLIANPEFLCIKDDIDTSIADMIKNFRTHSITQLGINDNDRLVCK
jgi:hypothetical protein